MHRYKNIVIIGTSHIARESIQEVERIISLERPEVVALELDTARFKALLEKTKSKMRLRDIRKVGFKGWVFAFVGSFVERKLGDKVGVNPGAEMLKAAEIAQKYDCKLALIDQKIEITLKKFSNALTWKEKLRFVLDLLKAPFSKEKIRIDLGKVPEEKLIHEMIQQLKKRYPNVYQVLVADRNEYMAKNLFKLMRKVESVVAVIGAGHEKEIIHYLTVLEKAN